MGQEKPSVITEALDAISGHIRDISAVMSMATETERKRLRGLTNLMLNLENDVLMRQIEEYGP